VSWLIPLAFFSFSNAKANYYLIIVMPCVALHMALLLDISRRSRGFRRESSGVALFAKNDAGFPPKPTGMAERKFVDGFLGMMLALCASALAVLLPFFPQFSALTFPVLTMPAQHVALIFLWSTAGLSLFTAWTAWYFPKIGLGAYGVLSLYFLAAVLMAVRATEPTLSDRLAADFIQQNLPDRTVYLYRHFEQHSSLAFYLKKPLKVIESDSSDLYWGNRLRPENAIVLSREQFQIEKKRRVVVVDNKDVNKFVREKMASGLVHSKQFDTATVFY
jgi:hypothetical protein